MSKHALVAISLIGIFLIGIFVWAFESTARGQELNEADPGLDVKPSLHFRPEEGPFGDVIPFFWKGQFHIFYLGQGGWHHMVSQDLLRWKELPVAVPVGAPGEPDSKQCASGSIIERDGTFHIFYLGRSSGVDGRTIGTVCRTTSRDLIHWQKDPKNPIITPDYKMYKGVTKDPFVFWNKNEQQYWMLIADRLRNSPTAKSGMLALAVSPDLERWERRSKPLWAPNTSTCEFEVPDVFEWNGTWYLTYTTYIDTTGSHYRMAKDPRGPWLAPAVEMFDDNAYYAAKTISNGRRRFAFGFITERLGRQDEGAWTPGENLAMGIREVTQQPDGSLAFKCPEEILRACGPIVPSKLETKLGQWSREGRSFRAKRVDGLAYAVTEGVPANLLVELSITLEPNTRSAGVFFRTTPDLARGYMLRLEPPNCRVVFEHWPKVFPAVRGAHPFMVQRPLNPNQFAWDRPITIQLLIDGTIAEVFVNNKIALVTRVYDHQDGCAGLFVEYGEAEFEDITFKKLP